MHRSDGVALHAEVESKKIFHQITVKLVECVYALAPVRRCPALCGWSRMLERAPVHLDLSVAFNHKWPRHAMHA
jgi:hypothetical protein